MEKQYKIYIMLSMSGTKFSKFLRLMSGSEFTHVSISFDNDLNTLYSFGRKKIHMPWIAGYVEEHPNQGIFKIYNPTCEVLEYTINEKQYLKLKEILKNIEIHKNEYKYNFQGLFCVYLNKPHKLYKRFTCTEFVAWLLNNIGISPNIEKDVSLIVPNDYYLIPNIKTIYKGELRNYNYT